MTKRYFLPVLLLSVLVLAGCRGPAAEGAPTPLPTAEAAPRATQTPAPTPDPTPTPDPIARQLAEMSDEALVGQLLVAGVEGTQVGEDARQLIQELGVGGVILFGRNVESAGQLAAFTAGLKELADGGVPLLLCVDQEGGGVSRMPPEVLSLPTPYDHIAAGGDAYALGQVLAEQCSSFGFQVDFAPVLDVWSNPDNRVIGRRALGTQAETVAENGALVTRGLMEGGVAAVGKHFPGHGDTAVDSHVGLPTVDKTAAELEELELIPFRRAIEEGLPGVMVAHILMGKIDPLLPASLSPAVVSGLLRGELGFDGVVFTDDLTMGAIAADRTVGEAAVQAVLAGCDMVLVCHGADKVRSAYYDLLFAVEEGTLTRERLEESGRRILALKAAYAAQDGPAATPDVEALNAHIRAVLP